MVFSGGTARGAAQGRGLRLKLPEAVAYIPAAVMEGAREGGASGLMASRNH